MALSIFEGTIEAVGDSSVTIDGKPYSVSDKVRDALAKGWYHVGASVEAKINPDSNTIVFLSKKGGNKGGYGGYQKRDPYKPTAAENRITAEVDRTKGIAVFNAINNAALIYSSMLKKKDDFNPKEFGDLAKSIYDMSMRMHAGLHPIKPDEEPVKE